jgi:hypothetical protein
LKYFHHQSTTFVFIRQYSYASSKFCNAKPVARLLKSIYIG